ncbi:MAG: right-handed parallel beta-helix repeat-containing protein [Planctomycetota bacterium]
MLLRAMLLILMVVALGMSEADAQNLIRVPVDVPTIQEAIDLAIDGDTIQVDAGDYFENLVISGKNIDLIGAGADVTSVDPVIGATVLVLADGANGMIRGLSFQGGNAPVGLRGGGLRIVKSSPTVIDCSIFENASGSSGGGGVAVQGGAPSFLRCRITGNAAISGGAPGGGVYVVAGSIAMDECIVRSNIAVSGAGIYTGEGVTGIIRNTRFSENEVLTNAGANAYVSSSDLAFWNCLFAEGNASLSSLTGEGSGIYVCGASASTSVDVMNCTFAFNDSIPGAQGVDVYAALDNNDVVSLSNCILWGASGPPIFVDGTGSSLSVEGSIVQGGFPGPGNCADDPQFVTGPRGDYYLSQILAGEPFNSPALDMGTTPAADACNGTPPYCMAARTTRSDEQIDEGAVDLGYHYQAIVFVRSDCNSDGLSDISDSVSALAVLFSSSLTPGCMDACDTNDDGVFDIADPVAHLSALFAGGPPPAAPYPDCGMDVTPDPLDCVVPTPCP